MTQPPLPKVYGMNHDLVIEILEGVILALTQDGFTVHERSDYPKPHVILTHPRSMYGSLISIDYKGDLWAQVVTYNPEGKRISDRTNGVLEDEFTLEMADPQVFQKFKDRVCY